MDFDYFYGRGADQFAFYQIPEILITDICVMSIRSAVKKRRKALNMCSWNDIMNVVARMILFVYAEDGYYDH